MVLAQNAPWKSCIAVCQKCAGKLNALEDRQPDDLAGAKTRLRAGLKELIAERDLKKEVRAVDTSCLDVCPEGLITVAHFEPEKIRILNVESSVTPAEILEALGLG